MQLFIAQVLPRHAIHRTQYIGAGREVFIVYSVTLSRGKFSDASALLHVRYKTRSSADADNRLDAFSGQSRSTNMVPFHMLDIVSLCNSNFVFKTF